MEQANFSLFENTGQNTNSQFIKVLIVDDQNLVRERLREIILSTDNHLNLVGMTDDGNKAIALIETLKPDVVLMDIEMPKTNGIKITEIISQRFPESKIIILSTHPEEEYAQQSIAAGASGYVLKQTSSTNLIAAIYTVHQGYSNFGLETLKKLQLDLAKTEPIKNEIDLKPKAPLQKVNPEDTRSMINQPNLQNDQSSIVTPTNNQNGSSLPTVKAEEFLPSISKWLTWGGVTVMTVLALAIPTTTILKYKTKIKAPATVRPVGEVRLVQAATEGKVVNILVKQGQSVNQGDIIAKVDPSRLQTQKSQLVKSISQQKLQLARLESQIGIITSQIAMETERINSEVLAARAELVGNQRNYLEKKTEVETSVKEVQAQIKAIQARLKAAKSRQTRYQAVADLGALSREQLEEAQLEVEQQQQEMETAQAQLERALSTLNPDSSQIEMAQQRIYQAQKSGQASIANYSREQEALRQRKIEIEQQLEQEDEELRQADLELNNTNITATATGTISGLMLRNPGQTLQPGQEIAQIVPSNTALEIKVLVSTQDIGKLESEQKVQMRISACPYPDYGTLNGQVSRIPRDTSKPQNNSSTNTSAAQSPAFYEVAVTPDQNDFGRGEDRCSLHSGMEGTADIITKEETVMRFLLRKARLISNL